MFDPFASSASWWSGKDQAARRTLWWLWLAVLLCSLISATALWWAWQVSTLPAVHTECACRHLMQAQAVPETPQPQPQHVFALA